MRWRRTNAIGVAVKCRPTRAAACIAAGALDVSMLAPAAVVERVGIDACCIRGLGATHSTAGESATVWQLGSCVGRWRSRKSRFLRSGVTLPGVSSAFASVRKDAAEAERDDRA